MAQEQHDFTEMDRVLSRWCGAAEWKLTPSSDAEALIEVLLNIPIGWEYRWGLTAKSEEKWFVINGVQTSQDPEGKSFCGRHDDPLKAAVLALCVMVRSGEEGIADMVKRATQ